MNTGHAKSYFNDALSRGDYYIDDQESGGRFHGKIAQKLGLTGSVEKKDFYRLCDNINPNTGDNLTARTKSNRTVGYDINFHCPKSVSILHALGNDKRVLEAFRNSVQSTMYLVEKDVKTRVRTQTESCDRHTGELIWGEFIHQTARPVDGSPPDPHLHAHCFVLNVTWDNEEQRYKAGQFRDIKRDMPYYQSVFHKTLASNLEAAGYQTRPTEKAFEVTVIPRKAIEVFSKRTDEIGRFAQSNNITSPQELDRLGARTRAKKEKGYSMQELRSFWLERVKDIKEDKDGGETRTAEPEFSRIPVIDNTVTPEQCIDYALEHCFERNSVMQERKILSTAISYGLRNKNLTIKDITAAFESDKRIIRIQKESFVQCTTHSVYVQEKQMIALARSGRGTFSPLTGNAHAREFSGLSASQADAVRFILASTDRITILRGGAGTGKTALMSEAVKTIESTGKKVRTFAPTSQSRNVLAEEGFENAQTVSRLLIDSKLQQELAGQVMWIDEAGLISVKDMHAILQIAHEQKARVVLSGDTRQHSSVERGDSLRILRTVGGVRTAGVSQIYRQRREDYKKAVYLISQGKVVKGFDELDRMGAIVEKDPVILSRHLVKDYMSSIDKNKTALIISPTHAQGETVTSGIREKLKERGIIKGKEYTVLRLKNRNLTKAQKTDPDNYTEGDIIQFSQNLNGIRKGEKCTVTDKSEKTVTIKNEQGKQRLLQLDRAGDFEVFEPKKIELATGDKIFVNRNSQVNGERLDNGTFLTVQGFNREGNIKVKRSSEGKEIILPQDFGNINHAYVLTSHASQGKTVDNVYIVQPSATFPAVDMKQFYVSVSRGRDSVSIYTDSKEELLEHVQISGDRLSAVELHDATPGVIHTPDNNRDMEMNAENKMKNNLIQEKYDREPEL